MNSKFAKYFSIATNYIYILASPVVLMLVLYYVFSKYVFLKENNLVLIIMILLGLITGYWSLFKEIAGLDKKKRKDNK